MSKSESLILFILIVLSGILSVVVDTVLKRPFSSKKSTADPSEQDGREMMDTMCCRTLFSSDDFSMMYDRLVHCTDAKQIQAAGLEAVRHLQENEPVKLMQVRTASYSAWSKFDPSVWQPFCSEETYRALLCCGTRHQNGYFREKCLRLLRSDTQALPYVLLCVNDWVPAIRRVAAASLPYLLADAAPGVLMTAMPCFDKLLHSERCQQDSVYQPWKLYPVLAGRFAECPEMVFRQPVYVRRLCYQTIFLTYQEHYDTEVQRKLLRCWMNGERDVVQHEWLVMMYLRWCKEAIPQSELISLMQSKRWRIRYHACERRYRQEGVWEGFEVLLLDRSSAVRAFAAYWLSRAGFDCITYCRSHRPEGIPLLGELGTKADIPYVRQYLKEQPCICLYALVKLGAEDTESLLWEYLHSTQPSAARTAFHIAWAQRIRFSRDAMLTELETAEDPVLRWRLVKLLGSTRDWQALPSLIRLVNDYPHLRTDILHAIENRYPWQQSLSVELAGQIEQAIAEAGEILPELLVRRLQFDLRRLPRK